MAESRSCTECGHPVSEQARFCEQCGAALRPDAEPLRAPEALAEKIASVRSAIEGERKQVTVMFADIVGSMELTRALETERWGVVLDRFLAIACRAIHDLEGTVNQFTGDGLMAVFGAPVAHEDHARRACLAALELQQRLQPFEEEVGREDGVEFRVRCGLNSGEVIVGAIGDDLHMDFAPIGNTSGMGKRMESLAPEGSTALSASTAALIEGEFELRELGEFKVKGMAEPQRVLELLGPGSAHSRLEAAEARGLSPFVGRGLERATLDTALEGALAGEGRVVGIVGEPGVGKSRLCREFVRSCRERGLRVNSGSAVAHGRAVPLLPVLAIFRDFFGIDERDGPEQARERIETALADLDPRFEPDLPLIFDFLGVPDPDRPLERLDPDARQRRLLAFVGRLVEARSRHEPAVIIIEDLQWIDEASAAFMEELVGSVEETRTLLVVTFRPEYEAEWEGSSFFERLPMLPLDDEAARELLEELLGADPSLEGLAEVIHGRTAGNPFFIEEVVRALAETGHLAGKRGSYRLAGPLDGLILPPTVQATLAARIDRLPRREKALVQTMSVIGKEIPEPVLIEVAELEESELTRAVRALEAAEFLTEARSNGHRDFTFKHPLTQEVAYASQLSAHRARAHSAVAQAIEHVYPDGLDERAALLAHHSEASGEILKAAQWHARAAAWISVSAPGEGMRHWRRVRELTDRLPSSDEVDQLAILTRISMLALAWRLGMSHEETAAIHAEGQQRLTGGDRTEERARRPAAQSGEGLGGGSSEDVLERALLDLGQAGALFLTGREREGLEALRPASRAAEEIGDVGLRLTVSAFSGFVAFWVSGVSLRDVFEGADRALTFAGDDVGAGAGLVVGCPFAHCLWVRAACRGFLGDLDGAARDYERSIDLAREHADGECEQYAHGSRSGVFSAVGNPNDALADAGHALKLANESDAPNRVLSALAFVASARLQAGDARGARDAAEQALSTIRELALGLNFEPWLLATLAEARLRLGEPRAALAAAEKATAIARDRTMQGISGELALARVLIETGGAGSVDAAETALARAAEQAANGGFRIYEPRIHRELAVLARLCNDEDRAKDEEAEAERILAEIKARKAPQAPSEKEIESLILDMLQAGSQLFGGQEAEGAATLKSGYRRLLEAGRPELLLEAGAAAAYACWTTGSPAEGIEFIDQALEQASEEIIAAPGLAVKSPHAQALWIRALCVGVVGRATEAQADLDRAAEAARAQDDPESEGYVHECRSRVLLDLNEIGAAAAEAERAVEVAAQAGNHQALASALASLAAICNEAAEFGAARAAAERGLGVVKDETAGLVWEPDLLAALGTAKVHLGDAGAALEAARKAVGIAEPRSLRRGEILSQLALARALAAGDLEDSEIDLALDRALELAEEAGLRALEWRVRCELADLAGRRGDEDTARLEGAKAERILADMRGPVAPARVDQVQRVLLDLSYATNVMFSGGEKEGLRMLRDAHHDAAMAGDSGLLLTASSIYGVAALMTGSFREGFEATDRAVSTAGDNVVAGSGLIFVNPYAHCLWVRAACAGELGWLERSDRDAERSLGLAREYGDQESQCFVFVHRILLASAAPAREPALEDAELAVEIAERTGSPNALVAAYWVLATARVDHGEFGAARDAAEHALAMIRARPLNAFIEPELLAALASARLGLGAIEDALATATDAVALAEERSLRRGALLGHLTMAQVLRSAEGGSDAAERALLRALELVRETDSALREPQVHAELAALARLRGDEGAARREEAEAKRALTEIGRKGSRRGLSKVPS